MSSYYIHTPLPNLRWGIFYYRPSLRMTPLINEIHCQKSCEKLFRCWSLQQDWVIDLNKNICCRKRVLCLPSSGDHFYETGYGYNFLLCVGVTASGLYWYQVRSASSCLNRQPPVMNTHSTVNDSEWTLIFYPQHAISCICRADKSITWPSVPVSFFPLISTERW